MAFALCGCQMGYIINSGYHQFGILLKKKKFERALQDPRLDEETKRKIRLVADVKKFAEDSLHLTKSRNYDSFVWLDDKYVVYAVTAAPKDALEEYKWDFPIIGTVPYKGFFNKTTAEEEAQEMQKKGYDTSVRGVTAYSTLGWFADPLLSTMTWVDDEYLVETIIHELTHVTLYVKNKSDFNENLATFVGEKGAEEYYKKIEGSNTTRIQKMRDQSYDSKLFSEFINEQLKALDEFYKSKKSDPKLVELREVEFQKIKDIFKKKWLPKMKTKNYEKWADKNLNNAVLISYKTYLKDQSLFVEIFEKTKAWPEFFAEAKRLGESTTSGD
jgi:predicted aminopeptidase